MPPHVKLADEHSRFVASNSVITVENRHYHSFALSDDPDASNECNGDFYASNRSLACANAHGLESGVLAETERYLPCLKS